MQSWATSFSREDTGKRVESDGDMEENVERGKGRREGKEEGEGGGIFITLYPSTNRVKTYLGSQLPPVTTEE